MNEIPALLIFGLLSLAVLYFVIYLAVRDAIVKAAGLERDRVRSSAAMQAARHGHGPGSGATSGS